MDGKHTRGDTVFSIDGEAFMYIAPGVYGGHIVARLYGDEGDEPTVDDDPQEIRQVFAQAPAPRLDADTRKAREMLSELEAQVAAAHRELAEVTRERANALQLVGKHPDLVPLAEWLEGRITHVVLLPIYGGRIEIKALADATEPNDKSDARNGHVRLLSLCGGRKYNDPLHWQLSAYSDGSDGKGQHCLLATSEANALERLQAWLDKRFNRPGEYRTVDLADCALTLGLRVPAPIAGQVQAARAKKNADLLAYYRNQITQAKETIERAEAALAKEPTDE